jgi:serine protease AprX
MAATVLASLVLAHPPAGPAATSATVPTSLLDAAAARPNDPFKVVIQGPAGVSSDELGTVFGRVKSSDPAPASKLRRKFKLIDGIAVTLTGKQILKLAGMRLIGSITPDVPLVSTGYENAEMWRQTANVTPVAGSPLPGVPAPQAPAIVVVDSGIDPSRIGDFGMRLIASVNFSSLSSGSVGDQEGHGTMVAGIAAGGSTQYPGVSPNSPLVDVRTADADGRSLTSDVIAGLDWVLAHKAQYGIGVVNMSMAGNTQTTFQSDPLDKAVERLWFNGIVVVAASGNSGTGTGEVDMSSAPGNDPFVITVGAVDQAQTPSVADDFVTPWSSYGHSVDGFSKPEISAPGRYLIMPVPVASTIARTLPERVVAPGYMWMSGTSFAAPVVSGAAAQILARHPSWTPDQVKGALMLTARPVPGQGLATGVGELDATAAAQVAAPPNPNENLYDFVVTDPATGARSFDAPAWVAAVSAQPGWTTANWTAGMWTTASWTTASWTTASWTTASWTTASWTTASWTTASNTASTSVE